LHEKNLGSGEAGVYIVSRYKSTGSSLEKLQRADYQALASIRQALRRFLAFSEEAALQCGLSPAQHQALLAIAGMAPPVTMGDLARWLDIKPHSAGELVDRLEGLQLVRRRADAGDRRRVILSLTPRAHAKLAGLSTVHRQELRRLSKVLKPMLATLG
jgi:DNA-binding MarR family transcriptional regulator